MEGTSAPPGISKTGVTAMSDSLVNPGERQPSALRSSMSLLSHPSPHSKGRTARKVGFLLDGEQGDLEVAPASTDSSQWFAASAGYVSNETKSPLWCGQELETLRELTLRCGENFARVASELGYEVVPQAQVETPQSEQHDSVGACASVQGCLTYGSTVAEGGSPWDGSFLKPNLCVSTMNPSESKENAKRNFFPHFSPIEQHFNPGQHFGDLRQAMIPCGSEFGNIDYDDNKNPQTVSVQQFPLSLWREPKNGSSDCSVSISDEMKTVPFITLPLDEMVMEVDDCSGLGSQHFSSISTFQASQSMGTPREITVHNIFSSSCAGNSSSTGSTMMQSNSSLNEYPQNRNDFRLELDPSSAVNPTTLFAHSGESEDEPEGELNVSSRNWSPNRDLSRNHVPVTLLPGPHPTGFSSEEYQTSLTQHNVSYSDDEDGGPTTRVNQNYSISILSPALNEPHSGSSVARPQIY
ncbi:unnamed protein product [Phytomonas sp. EM1]|nr:unnamed protein product [Phytomonas sp. EM1]|eukprot:CCW59619.1 unnamed protein product [Phytomonas sp. isolate EM1]